MQHCLFVLHVEYNGRKSEMLGSPSQTHIRQLFLFQIYSNYVLFFKRILNDNC